MIGPKDLEKNQVFVVRRDTREKMVVSMDEIAVKLRDILETMQQDMYDRANEFLKSHIDTAVTLDEMTEKFKKNRGFVKACWCGDPECEGEVKYVTGGAATRCLIEDEDMIWHTGVSHTKPAGAKRQNREYNMERPGVDVRPFYYFRDKMHMSYIQ